MTKVFGWMRPIARWAERVRAQIEIDADAHALAHGSSRQAIAQAIVKLNSRLMSSGLAAFGTAVDLRLRALVCREAPPARTCRNDIRTALGVAAAVVVVCSALSV